MSGEEPRRAPLGVDERAELGERVLRLALDASSAYGLPSQEWLALRGLVRERTGIGYDGPASRAPRRWRRHRSSHRAERALGVSWDTLGRALAGARLNPRTLATLRDRLSPSAFGDAC